jgi:HK97 family phage major capsid protein
MPDPTPETGLTDAQLSDLIGKSVGAAVKAELAPLAESQKGIADLLTKREEKSAEFNEKELGKYPYGRKARALAMAAIENGSHDPEAAAFAIQRSWAPSVAEPTLRWLKHAKEQVNKGLTVGSSISAGNMVFPAYDPEWIELLRNNTVVRANARTVPMPRGATIRRKQTGAATASYQGELGPISTSTQTTSLVSLSYKKLTAATVVSNDLIRFAGGGEADRFVQDDLLRVAALREDRAFLVGNPPVDAGSPQGIRYQTVAGNVAASAGTSLANFQTDLTGMVSSVQSKNIMANPGNSAFVMSASTFWTIFALTTTTGDWVFAQGLGGAQPRILGFPVLISTNLEVSNSFIGASSGLVFFIHWPSMEIHDSMARTVEAFRGGAYSDSTGTIQSGISNDETVITCISEHDFLQAYTAAAAIRTGYAT